MKSKRVIGLIALLVLLLTGIFFTLFEKQEVLDLSWNVDYSYESKEPHGGWVFSKMLEEAYGVEHIIKLKAKNFIPRHEEDKSKGYLIISDYISFEKRKVDELAQFVEQGNEAIIITSDQGYYIDTLFNDSFSRFGIQDSIVNINNPGDERTYELSYYYAQLDSASSTFYYVLDSLEKAPETEIKILSYLRDTLPIFIKLPYGKGHFYIHTLPDAFSNIGIRQKGMKDYVINTLPLLEIDTLFLDHYSYSANWGSNESPLQFIMTQPALKWAYFISVFGLLLFVASRGKRKQRIIPNLPINENTSLEYIQTLSELYRSQYQHDKLAKHLQIIFTQWVKKKYYLTPDDPKYIAKISQKSKIAEEQINSLLNRLDKAVGNKRFGAEQLTNLHTDLNQFYNNCQ